MTERAAQSAGLLPAHVGLSALANARALPGGVRINMDHDGEGIAEAADGRNYSVWGIEPIYEAAVAGDERASSAMALRMGALQGFVIAYANLKQLTG